jgi:transposase
LRRKLAELEATLAATKTQLDAVTAERDKLRRAYEALKEHYELLRRKIFAARAERIDVSQLEMEFKETRQKLEAMARQLGHPETSIEPPGDPKTKKKQARPKGRRDLREEGLPEERIELTNPELEGKAERIGFEESCRYAYRKGGPIRVVIARATYKTRDENGNAELVTTSLAKELVKRGLLAPSMIAHVLVSKYRFGIPFHRLAEMLRSQGVRLDDGTMCRYAEDVGATLGCIVEAMAKQARATAFCLSTDATGVCIQPEPLPGKRQACRKGHFFVVLADQDHVFFEYQREHTSKAACDMFRGFNGYLQVDAHAIYNALFRGEARVDPDDKSPDEVGCWSHARRRFWEAATVAKDAAAREALLRIRVLFELEEKWAKLPPQKRHEQRQAASRRLIDDFFAWAEDVFGRIKGTRGLATSAFGYAVRQREALRRFLDDGRLPLTNNHSERALRPIAVGRKNWLFFGSDDHAVAAANLFSLIASCKLHDIDAESYFAEIIRVVPHWPRDRYLELAPKHWTQTRSRLNLVELRTDAGVLVELGPLTIPPPISAEEQSAPS